MKVLVDTSVWVDFFNGYPSSEARALRGLLQSDHDLCTCGVVISEVFQGLHKPKDRAQATRLFLELGFLEAASIDLYFRSADLFRNLRQRGRTIRSTIDCLIAVLAEENRCALLARDRDLDQIVESGLLSLARWPLGSLPT